jgi:hypothetical protein
LISEDAEKRGATGRAPLSINLSPLDASVERQAQAKCFLTGRAFRPPKLLSNLPSAGFLPSKCLKSSQIICRPRTPLAIFHKLSPDCQSVPVTPTEGDVSTFSASKLMENAEVRKSIRFRPAPSPELLQRPYRDEIEADDATPRARYRP